MLPVYNAPGLDDHVEAASRRVMRWGVDDCCLWPADWIKAATGVDPAAAWRGCYRTERGAMALLRRSGGLPALFAMAMKFAGFSMTDDPATGDVGVVVVPVALRHGRVVERPVGAIRLGGLWGVRSKSGVVAGDFEQVSAWRVPVEGE